MAKFEMDTEFVRKLAEILEEKDLGEIELADGDRKIRIARPTVTYSAAAPTAAISVERSRRAGEGSSEILGRLALYM